MSYHQPVMLQECLEGLQLREGGVYVDLTFGGGGHSRAILSALCGGRLFGFDQDDDARKQAEHIDDTRFQFVQANFRYLKRYLKLYGVQQVDGILADLGVSSHQLDEAERGFSTRFNAVLDMRMDQQGSLTAKEVLNTYSEKDLHRLLGQFGEVRNARTLAGALVAARTNQPFEQIDELKAVVNRFAPKGKEYKYQAQVFQALRIEVNDELRALEEALEQSAEVLAEGGRLVVMSYHSLEDRLVKNFMAKGKFRGEMEKDFYGNMIRPLVPVTRKPVEAGEEEIATNSRARSAKLRIAEKV
ncbi:16S rRNA (cytosine(1402)-N(4))-methyltransferase RsmH [Nafulsella turpanensis]|uniref:16S rRNA (cytosine(1402)-N(4))-methyltransferase RsmH n=1 Tax=Nafulsella turpanensis TaxID=1265690 RepID=UPI00036B88B2|nr:16S rRNA (cytosine(1402)-N(4))-methyltransferase RsmH [Nafulsella turpanensis]